MHTDTIVAIATAPGSGAIAVIRISGPEALSLTDTLFTAVKGNSLQAQTTHTMHLGYLHFQGQVLDQVLVTLFKNPHSYTGEDVVEISCHGSGYIQQRIVQAIIESGARMAQAGEFTLRAFLNGKLDLAQAEAVADLIASDSAAAHQLALSQMRGGFSREIENLRAELLNFTSLIELELDFAEEDVAFADRKALKALLDKIETTLKKLADSFALGNVLKNGIPVAIVGKPNAGKSTLMNALLNEERALVSDIAGTTRDSIEDELQLGGIRFRFIDTAGIRDTTDVIEKLGIQRTFDKIKEARVVIYLVSLTALQEDYRESETEIDKIKSKFPDKTVLVLANKSDLLTDENRIGLEKNHPDWIFVSAKNRYNLDKLTAALLAQAQSGQLQSGDTTVSNARHFEALNNALKALVQVKIGLAQETPSDLIAIDLKEILYELGSITGKVTNDEVLGNIFANFCIGK